MTADWITTLGTAAGSAWLSGINLYATVVTLGVLQRFHLVKLPGGLNVLGEWWLIGLAATLYLIEFVADKIPAVDSAWDAIHTFIRVPAGAILAATAFAEFDPGVKMAAMILGGAVALSSHGTKAATRLAANTSPEPFSNVALSLTEDVVAFGSTILMVFFPVVMLIIVAIFLIVVIWLAPKIVRALRRLNARLRNLFGSHAAFCLLIYFTP
jgi:sensor histidine kinase YesM